MMSMAAMGRARRGRSYMVCIVFAACGAWISSLDRPFVGALKAEAVLQRSRRQALPELLTLAESAEDQALEAEVDANFKSISPQDMATLQLRLSQSEGDSRKPIQRLLASIQKSMESRMEAATKDIEALMQSSGNIEANIRDCLDRQENVLPIIAVLQMNIARAQKTQNQQLERALTFLYNTINEQMESQVPMVNRVLSRCLSTEDSDARRELLKAYFAEDSEEEKPQLMAQAIVGLVKEAQGQRGQKGFDLKSALERIREVALDVGVVQGEVCAPEVQDTFMEDMEPLFDAYANL